MSRVPQSVTWRPVRSSVRSKPWPRRSTAVNRGHSDQQVGGSTHSERAHHARQTRGPTAAINSDVNYGSPDDPRHVEAVALRDSVIELLSASCHHWSDDSRRARHSSRGVKAQRPAMPNGTEGPGHRSTADVRRRQPRAGEARGRRGRRASCTHPSRGAMSGETQRQATFRDAQEKKSTMAATA
jgi:hypothetical protein